MRIVGVKLRSEVAEYVRDMDKAGRTTKGVRDELAEVASAEQLAAQTTDKLAGELSELARDARRLDADIHKSTAGIRELARAVAHASDEAERADLWKKLTAERGQTQKLVDLRKLVDVDSADGLGTDLAEQVSVSFAARLGPLIARAPMAGMNPAALAIGAPLAAGAALTVGTAMAGAIVGGVGIGGVVGGMKLAAQDPAVKAAGTALGASLSGMLGEASAAFVPETLTAIEIVRQRTLSMEPDFQRAFSGAARYVYPLTDALMDAGQNAMPGVIDAIEHAGPVVDSLGDGLRDLGDAVGDSLSGLAEYADEGARALDVLFFVAESGLRSTVALIGGMAEVYGWAEKLGAIATGRTDRLGQLVAADDAAAQSARGLGDALGGVREKARGAAASTGDLIDALVELNGLQLNANDAEREFQRAIDDARTAFQGKTRDFQGGTERGRDYGEALDDIARKARDSAQAIYDQSGSVGKANAKIDEGRTALYNQARQYGRTDKEARDYVNSVLAIPRKWDTKVNLHADKALQDAKAMRSVLQSLKNRNITIGVYWKSNGDLKVPGGTILKNDRGGIYEHAADGLVNLRQAAIYSPRGPARYAFAEPSTGGEAFVPKNGDPRRSLGILEHAASWYGASVQPSQAASSQPTSNTVWQSAYTTGQPMQNFAGGTQRIEVVITGDAAGSQGVMAEIVKNLRYQVRTGGGDVQATLGDGRSVGYLQGRQANLYAR
ncbi:hypothetical protein [Micromonospora arida]